MAKLAERLVENVAGEFYVDESCIDCATCRQIAPALYGHAEARGLSYVQRQPRGEEETRRALMALVACPTASIGTEHKVDVRPGIDAFPEPIAADVGDVLFCGFTDESSFGAWSWLVRRPGGNVLVDSPRPAGPLLRRIEALGGVRLHFLTHRDDVAEHETLHARFGTERVLHADDVSALTRGVERRLTGREPTRLADDLVAVPVPGHTRGSAALLYRDTFLFTGDHLWWSSEDGRLDASRSVCWWSWAEQLRSLERLLDLRFEWVLPGHGEPWRAASAAAMRAALERALVTLRRLR
ncbi:MAG TPA: MBL fold metallo-hydrolase [Myxococcota bacterium]|jgi:glyoxylase-like metal-dependent hydrolase (beta-lactamase superfamily II)/ferredoxin|nr:MBL fold metallo-hydrolase [Myxococcota bacterium]